MIKTIKVVQLDIIMQEDGRERYYLVLDVLWKYTNREEWFNGIGFDSTSLLEVSIEHQTQAIIERKIIARTRLHNLQSILDSRYTK